MRQKISDLFPPQRNQEKSARCLPATTGLRVLHHRSPGGRAVPTTRKNPIFEKVLSRVLTLLHTALLVHIPSPTMMVVVGKGALVFLTYAKKYSR